MAQESSAESSTSLRRSDDASFWRDLLSDPAAHSDLRLLGGDGPTRDGVPCHRLVLGALSAVLRRSLSHLVQAVEGDAVVHLPDHSQEEVR